MKIRKSQIVEPDGKIKTCKCRSNLFYLTRGTRKRNFSENRKSWEAKSHYIYTCVECKNKEYGIIYDWRKVFCSMSEYNKKRED